MEKFTRADVEFSYEIPLTVERVCKVKKVGVYPMNGVHNIHNKLGETTLKNIKICNIYFLKRFIRAIKKRVDRTQIDQFQNGLPLSVRRTKHTTYGDR